MSRVEKKLTKLHELLCDELTQRLKDGEGEDGKAAPATLNVIRQFLRDNHIDGAMEGDSPFAELMKELPDDFKKSFGERSKQ